jgi:Tc toxin complex TcA C-terminal TcB-binding domain/Neuraminidase-like domain/Salmonella virulence plasmid 28.1kDa A protein
MSEPHIQPVSLTRALNRGRDVQIEGLEQADRAALEPVLNKRLADEISRLAQRVDPKLGDELKVVTIDYSTVRSKSLSDTLIVALEGKRGRELSETDRAQLEFRLLAVGARASVADLLGLDEAVGSNRLLSELVSTIRTREISLIAGLDEAKIAMLQDEGVDIESIGTAGLDDLIAREVVSPDEARKLGFLGSLSLLSGSNLGLLEALDRSGRKELKEFVTWDRDVWKRLIEDNRIEIPDVEKDAEDYAETLRRAVERTFPSDYIVARIAKPQFDEEVDLVKRVVARKISGHELVRDGAIDETAVDIRHLSADQKGRLEKELVEFDRFAKTYRHLGVANLVNDDGLTPAEKSDRIKTRLRSLNSFVKDNPELDVYLADFVDREVEFDWRSVESEDKPHILRQMRAIQRVSVLSDHAEHSLKLLAAGFSSSAEIARVSEHEFLTASGLDRFEGTALYGRAYQNTISVSHLFEAIREASSGIFDKLRPANSPNLLNDLRELDGYSDLFGGRNYCRCEHCRSLLSPSAYFADMMKFIQDSVSKRVFEPSQTNHPLYLKRRRPDLWTLDLSCHSAQTQLPYIQIVNEVLTAFLEAELRPIDVTASLSGAQNSVTLPANLDLEELRLYLSEFELDLADIYELLDQNEAKVRRERLEMSVEELALITTPDPDGVRARFGDVPVSNMDVQDFMKFTGMDREAVTALLSVRSLGEISQVGVKVVELPGDIQQFAERLESLTTERLDLIHRFLRLAQKIDYGFAETDLLLESLQAVGLLTSLQSIADGAPAILLLAPLFEIRDALGLSVEELAAFVGPLPDHAPTENKDGLYDRLFDRVAIFGVSGKDAEGRPIFNPQATLPADRTLDQMSGFLAGGLGVTETELTDLLVLRGMDVTVDQQVDTALITNLYRHARMARGLGIRVSDLIGLVELTHGPALMTTIGDYLAVAKLADWVKDSPFSIGMLNMVLSREAPGSGFAATKEAAAAMVLDIKASEQPDKPALLFTALQTRYDLTAEQLEKTFLGKLTSLDLSDPGIATALEAGFTDGQPDTPSDLDVLVSLMSDLERTTRIFNVLGLSAAGIAGLAANPARYGVADAKALTLSDVRNLTAYTELLKAHVDIETALQDALAAYLVTGTLSGETIDTLATLLGAPRTLIASIGGTLTLPAEPLPAFTKVASVVRVAARLGVDGFALDKLTATDKAGLADAHEVALTAVHAKYPDDTKRATRLAELDERTNTRRRDALTAFIIGHYKTFKFKDRRDLYKFFLLDTEMSSCFLTSRVVCANSSLQTYISRCLLNLEQSDPVLNPDIPNLKVNPTWIPIEEWHWRRNYRVWEANRKVFLFPETYIDPALRQDKSHLFSELEENLLQQKITRESAEAAYKTYLAGFAELAGLRYAGAFAEAPANPWSTIALNPANTSGSIKMMKVTDAIVGPSTMDFDTYKVVPNFFQSSGSDSRTYYLFARTSDDPYRYFYRTYRRNGDVWGNWIPMDLPIEADRISALEHLGRIYVFWNEVKYKEISRIKGGDVQYGSVRFEVTTRYSSLSANGSWTPVQKMPLGSISIPRDDIYFRVIGYFPGDEDEQDRLKEEVYAEFIHQVFRKPYATLSGDSSYPINLAYVWSQEQGVNEVIYATGNFTATIGAASISSSGTSFTVTNNQFGETRPISVVVKVAGVTINARGQATILTSSMSAVTIHELSFMVGLSAQSIPNTIFTTKTAMSPWRNEIRDSSTNPIDRRSSYLSLGHSTRNYLAPEHLLGATASTAFFVENNYTSFTKSNRTVAQFDSGTAFLSLPGGGNESRSVILNTILTDELGGVLYGKGLEEFLSLTTQQLTDRDGQGLDFQGSYGQYYWEMFFHIPFLIGNHFNANQKFDDAKWWYERVFNPTSPEDPAEGLPSDHNWRFREFRSRSQDTLKDILTDEEAIAAYREDPFDPHAIARLRHSAYQKAIVMKYVDNLIDWADVLFARDTRESIAEASILYTFAREVLGHRPVEVGECETKDPLNYEILAGANDEGSEFLILLENLTINRRNLFEFAIKPLRGIKAVDSLLRATDARPQLTALDHIRITAETKQVKDRAAESRIALANDVNAKVRLQDGGQITGKEAVLANRIQYETAYGQSAVRHLDVRNNVVPFPDAQRMKTLPVDKAALAFGVGRPELDKHVFIKPWPRLPAETVTRQSVAGFCAPHNADLLDYWDRIDKQLTKIRNCQNIHGLVRTLPLLEPPIDPMMLVRARAAGLSLDDIAALVPGVWLLPAYRFGALLPIARQAAQMVQNFGQGLLSALEKKDVEELRFLQLTHEHNLQALTRSVKQRQISDSKKQLGAAEASLARAELRLEYYTDLIETGLTGWEVAEQVATHTASGLRIAESVVHLMAGLTFLIPQLGSPFAMKYGGQELGHSGVEFAAWTSAMAGVANQIAQSAGLEARHQRRGQDWRHERDMAREDVRELKARAASAEIHVALAEKDLEMNERAMEHIAEIEDFHKGKFGGLSLYNHLAAKLSRINRRAYTVAHDLAQAAERAYQFETDSPSFFIAGDNWEPSRAGLVAGEQLMVQLAAMEADFIKLNTRRPEIRQSFSLAMLDPGELVQLRQTGACTIRIRELSFEVLYPGHYRRLIKGVRVSIPAVVGPFTNVGAKLTLLKGELEAEDGDALTERPVAKNTSISLSGAVNDSGTFEFSHRDERFLPFEGAGAISEWKLELPSAIRSFDYNTISDVLIHLDYTALDGDRAAAEANLADVVTSHAAGPGLFRLISLRHELPSAWARLTMPPPLAPEHVDFALTDAYFPYLFNGRDVQITATKLYLRPNPWVDVAPPAISLNGKAVSWNVTDDIARPGAAGETDKLKGGTVVWSGAAKRDWRFNDAAGTVDPSLAHDLLLLIRYTVAMN